MSLPAPGSSSRTRSRPDASLHSDEVLVALSISSNNDADAKAAFDKIPELKGCNVHSSVMLDEVDEQIFKKLGMYLTCEPKTKVI